MKGIVFLLTILIIGMAFTGCQAHDESYTLPSITQVKEIITPIRAYVAETATKMENMDLKIDAIMQRLGDIRASQDAIIQDIEAIKHEVSYGQAVPPVNITINGTVNGQGGFTATLHSFDEAVDYINSYRYTTPR